MWRGNLVQVPTFFNKDAFKNYLNAFYNKLVLTVWKRCVTSSLSSSSLWGWVVPGLENQLFYKHNVSHVSLPFRYFELSLCGCYWSSNALSTFWYVGCSCWNVNWKPVKCLVSILKNANIHVAVTASQVKRRVQRPVVCKTKVFCFSTKFDFCEIIFFFRFGSDVVREKENSVMKTPLWMSSSLPCHYSNTVLLPTFSTGLR